MTDVSRKLASSLAVLATAGLALAAPAPARAADLGGDCCADLETRVAALESTAVRKGNKKVSLTISGRVHANIMAWQDNFGVTDPGVGGAVNFPFDHLSDVYFGNAANNESRIVFDGDAKISPDLTAGFEMTIKQNPSDSSDDTTKHSQINHQSKLFLKPDVTYVFLRSERLGELRLGSMFSAADDAYYVDFGAPSVAGGLAGSRFVGDFKLRDTGLPGTLTDVTYAHVLYELSDSLENRLMYISPTVGGFTFKADVGGDDTASVGLGYSLTQGKWNVSFGAGYQVSRSADGDSINGGQAVQLESAATAALATETSRDLALSASIYESASGLFATAQYSVAYADVPGRQDATNWYGRAGWTKDVSGMGATTIDVQYERTDNLLQNDTSAHLWGIGIDQALDAVASNIYLHYQHNSFDTTDVVTNADDPSNTPTANCGGGCLVDAQSIDSLTAGMIVRF